MTRHHALAMATLMLMLQACAYDMVGLNKATAGVGVVPGQPALPTLPQFLGSLEKARGTQLSVTERAAVGSMVADTRNLVENSQAGFYDSLGDITGVNGVALKLLVPEASRTISNQELVERLENKMNRKLNSNDASRIHSANQARVQALAGIRNEFSEKVGKRIGLPRESVSSLIPALGI